MINVIANIVGVAIVVGAIATVLDKRINALQGELHRHKRQTETEIRSVEHELNYINSLQQDGNSMADEAERVAYSARVNVEEAIDKIEEISRELRGETYAIEFWGGDCYGGFKKNGAPIDVGYSEAVLMTRQEAERIKKMLGTGAIVNRSKTILKNLEEK